MTLSDRLREQARSLLHEADRLTDLARGFRYQAEVLGEAADKLDVCPKCHGSGWNQVMYTDGSPSRDLEPCECQDESPEKS